MNNIFQSIISTFCIIIIRLLYINLDDEIISIMPEFAVVSELKELVGRYIPTQVVGNQSAGSRNWKKNYNKSVDKNFEKNCEMLQKFTVSRKSE